MSKDIENTVKQILADSLNINIDMIHGKIKTNGCEKTVKSVVSF